MEQHQFKILYSEDDVYRIIDLTDTNLVGVTEMYESDDWLERKWRAQSTKGIKSKKDLGAKIVGYGIFIYLDEGNMKSLPLADKEYLRAVLRQMAKYYEQEVIAKNPKEFENYYVPQGRRNAKKPNQNNAGKGRHKGETSCSDTSITKKEHSNLSRWLRGWKLVLLILCGVILIGYIFCLVFFPSVRGKTLDAIWIGYTAFMVILLLVYAYDKGGRR